MENLIVTNKLKIAKKSKDYLDFQQFFSFSVHNLDIKPLYNV